MRLSIVLVGHAHLVLAALALAFVARLVREPSRVPGSLTGMGALGITTGAAAIPGVFLLGVPALLTFVTGLAFIPAVFGWARTTLDEERRLLGERADPTPR